MTRTIHAVTDNTFKSLEYIFCMNDLLYEYQGYFLSAVQQLALTRISTIGSTSISLRLRTILEVDSLYFRK